MSFHTGDVFGAAGPQIDKQYFLLDSVVLPTIQGKIYVFLLAYPRLPCMVLGQTVYRISRNPVLMHITSMLPQYVHFMTYEPVTGPSGVSRDDGLF